MVKVPRNRIRRVLRRHQPNYRLSPQMDILVYLNYILFLKRLAAESEAVAAEQGSPSVQPEHVKAVMSLVLRRMKA